MSSRLTHFRRVAVRSLWLAAEILLALMRFGWLTATHGGSPGREARTGWLQGVCRRALCVFGIELHIAGPIPSRGLLACNHLSYLDILVLGATAPCVFVSKCEVRCWPVFGWFASLAGTIFLRRDRRSEAGRVTHEMRLVLDAGALVVLFPEGTTSDGRQVLPFKSALLQSATELPQGLAVACIEYSLPDGSVVDEVCYWRDMTLLPHLLNLMGKGGIEARLRFAELQRPSTDRKQLARQLHSEVVRLKESGIMGQHPMLAGTSL